VGTNETGDIQVQQSKTGFLSSTLSDQAIEALAPFVAKARGVTGADETTAPFFMKDLVDGILVAGRLMAQASFQYSTARTARKRAEGVALLDKFPEFVKERKIKGTVAEGEAFVSLDEDVRRTAEEEARCEALYGYIQNAKQCLTMAHDDLKKAVYTTKDYAKDRTPTLA